MDRRRRALMATLKKKAVIDISQYLTIVALEDGLTAKLSKNSCEYCINGDGNWKQLPADTDTQSVNAGKTLSFRGNLVPPDSGGGGIGTFTISKKCNLEGNCMSLLYGDDSESNTSVGFGAFYQLFYNCRNIVSVSGGFLPATTLSDYCYHYMFHGCSSLVNAPKLPATKLANNCYTQMFYGCTSLVNAPELPATTLAEYCYSRMFYDCTSLVNAPKKLPATTLAKHCYYYMFSGCSSLVDAPQLPATRLSINCYNYMFFRCRNLVNAPQLPATMMYNNCYADMFYECTSLVNAPELPATTLADSCYNSMFYGCRKLVNAPELPATTLTSSCYSGMFQACTSLVNVPKKLPATTLYSYCYSNMFQGCSSLVNAPELPATKLAHYCYNGMFYNCSKLVNAPKLPATTLANSCYYSMLRGCSSLVDAPELPATKLEGHCYRYMFYGCTKLTNAPELPATELVEYCYNSMFNGCTKLTNAPELSATTLARYCYSGMFQGCTNLNYIKMLATDISATDCLTNWVSNVASTGIFVKHPDMTSLPTGNSGVPVGWTIVNDGEEDDSSIPDYSSYRGVYIEDVKGYLYTEAEWDGSKTANGIAVLTDNCRFVMALQNAYNTSFCRWGGYNKTVSGIVTTTEISIAKADYAGASNTDTIISELNGYNDSYVTGAPAAEYCKAFTFPNGKMGYLGAAGEWQTALDNKTAIVSALSKCGGSVMKDFYWTSTQSGSNSSWAVYWNVNQLSNPNKSGDYFVRAFTTLKSDESPYAFSFNIEVAKDSGWTANAEQLVQINKMFAIVTKFLGMKGGEFTQDNAPQEFDLRINGVRNFNFYYAGVSNESDVIDVYLSFTSGDVDEMWFAQISFPWNNPVTNSFAIYSALTSTK